MKQIANHVFIKKKTIFVVCYLIMSFLELHILIAQLML